MIKKLLSANFGETSQWDEMDSVIWKINDPKMKINILT